MFTLVIIVTLLAVLYGLAWHNEPAKAHQDKSHPTRKP